MRRSLAYAFVTLTISSSVLAMFATPAAASSITIVGGRPEQIDLPCLPCRGGFGLAVGTQGYSAQDCPLTQQAMLPMSMVLDAPSVIRFSFIGLDSWSYNQFYVDQNGDGDPFNDPAVFDLPRPADDPWPVRPSVLLSLPAGALSFGFRTAVDLGDFRTLGSPSEAFGIFASCQPTLIDPNPRTCTQGYLGFADGVVFTTNDDHQDLGVQFEIVPEPATLILMAIGLFTIAGLARRRTTTRT